MRISDVDPDELDDEPAAGSRGRRRRWWVIGGLVAALVAGVAAFVVLRGDDDEAEVADTGLVDTAPVTDDTAPDIDVIGPAPDGFPDFGSDYVGAELDLLYQRTTETGIRLVIHDMGQWAMPVEFIEGDIDITAATIAAEGIVAPAETIADEGFAPAPVTTVVGGWVPEPWCSPSGGFRVSMTYKDAVAVSSGSRYEEPRDGLQATMFSGGYAESQPFRVLVLQVSDDITLASVSWDDGATDAAVPVDGWVALATPGAPSGKFVLDLETAGGGRTIDWNEIPRDGDAGWQKGCTPPPPELPAPGEQPDDADESQAAIADAFDLMWDQDVPFEEKGELILDDTTGVADAIDAVMNGGFGDVARTAVHEITDLVFVSPDEAWFKYDINTTSGAFTDRFGIAYRINGTWKITRAVICQDLSLAGGQCVPFVDPIQPPAAG